MHVYCGLFIDFRMGLRRSCALLSREAQRFRNVASARYEARDLSRRYHEAQAVLDRVAWDKAKLFKDPAESLWVPFLLLACVPLSVLFASIPSDLERISEFLSLSARKTSVALLEDLETERAIQEYRDSLDSRDAEAFTKPELWGH